MGTALRPDRSRLRLAERPRVDCISRPRIGGVTRDDSDSDPTTQDNLTIFPIVTDFNRDTHAFLTLHEGRRSGQVVITEKGASTTWAARVQAFALTGAAIPAAPHMAEPR